MHDGNFPDRVLLLYPSVTLGQRQLRLHPYFTERVKLKTEHRCYYCGERAQARDHVIPQQYHNVRSKGNFRDTHLVPACRECNSIAGSKLFWTLKEKKDYVQGRIRERNKKFLNMPDWTPEELGEADPFLREFVETHFHEKLRTLRRLAW